MPDNDKKRRRRRRRLRLERVYGWFSCSKCKHQWASAHVYCEVGTYTVFFKQGCKKCKTNMFPYKTDYLECWYCGDRPCTRSSYLCDKGGEVRAEEQGENLGEKKKAHEEEEDDADDEAESVVYDIDVVNPNFSPIDPNRKPHERSLCGKCRIGFYCHEGQQTRPFTIRTHSNKH